MIEQIDVHRQILVFKKRWPLCVSVFVSVMLLGLIATVGTPKLYRASASIKVNTDSPESKFWPAAMDYQKMSSSQVLIKPGKDNKSVVIEVLNSEPQLAADLVNKTVADYLAYQNTQKDQAIKQEENSLNLQLKEAKEQLALSEAALQDYKIKNQLINQPTLKSQLNRVRHRIGLFEEELVKVQAVNVSNKNTKEQILERIIKEEQEKEMRFESIISEMDLIKTKVELRQKEYGSKLEQVGKDRDKYQGVKLENVFSVDSAEVPASLYQPNWKKNVILSLLFALLLSIGIAFILEMLEHRTFQSKEQIEEALQVPFLGFSSSPELRTGLLLMSPGDFFKSLLVTSSKTSLNLALALAESGKKVLLVDCNFKDHATQPGFSTLLLGEAQLEDLKRSGTNKKLSLLEAGPRPPIVSGLFQTKKFLNTLESLKKLYDTVIFDASILSLGVAVDGVVLGIEAGVTSRESVEKSVQDCRDLQVNLLGVVLDESTQRPGLSFNLLSQFLRRYENKATI